MSEGEQKPNGCAQGCGGLVLLFIVLAVFGALFGDGDSDRSSSSGSSSSSRSDTQMTTMRGDIMVYDQATCAGGPMVKVSAGARGPEPAEFKSGNAPCRLVFTMQVPANATQYKVQVENLPARIFYPDQMKNSKGEFEVEMTVYGD